MTHLPSLSIAIHPQTHLPTPLRHFSFFSFLVRCPPFSSYAAQPTSPATLHPAIFVAQVLPTPFPSSLLSSSLLCPAFLIPPSSLPCQQPFQVYLYPLTHPTNSEGLLPPSRIRFTLKYSYALFLNRRFFSSDTFLLVSEHFRQAQHLKNSLATLNPAPTANPSSPTHPRFSAHLFSCHYASPLNGITFHRRTQPAFWSVLLGVLKLRTKSSQNYSLMLLASFGKNSTYVSRPQPLQKFFARNHSSRYSKQDADFLSQKHSFLTQIRRKSPLFSLSNRFYTRSTFPFFARALAIFLETAFSLSCFPTTSESFLCFVEHTLL